MQILYCYSCYDQHELRSLYTLIESYKYYKMYAKQNSPHEHIVVVSLEMNRFVIQTRKKNGKEGIDKNDESRYLIE